MAEQAKQLLSDIQDSWNKEKEKYAMYLRKSRADMELEALGEGETLARHKAMLYELAAKLDIHPDQIVIYHEVVSGESIASRPEMQRLLNDVYQNMYAGVMVAEVERLARGNTKDQGEVSDAFQYSHTKIITPSKIYDPNNEFDQEYFEFGLFMSRREYKTIKRRMEAGRMQSIQEGNYVGSIRPYGYNAERINKKERILVENPNESKYVKMMFNWFTIDRLSAGQIARKLTEMQVPTMTGNREWHRSTVKDILQNVHYVGKVRWNRRRSAKEFDVDTGTLSKTKRRLSPEDYKVFKGKHKAIITEEQFEYAQTLFTGQVPVKAQTTIINPFVGLMQCAKCGKNVYYHNFPSRSTTVPRFIHSGSILCKMKSLPADQVIDAIVEGLKAYIADFEIKMTNDSNHDEIIRHNELVAALEAELDKQEKKRRKLFDAFEEGVYDNNEFIERKNAVNSTIDEIKRQIQDAKKEAPEPVDYEEKIVSLHQLIDCIQNPNIDAKAKNIFLKSMIDYIEYDVEDYGRKKGGKPIIDIHLL